MPCISMFYGILIYMYWYDDNPHKLPHIHVKYQGMQAVFAINECKLLIGDIPNKQRKMIEAWMEIHRDELLADWDLAVDGADLFNIDPLK